MTLDEMDHKQKALLSLKLAADTFFLVALAELAKFPGRAAQNRELVDGGQAHLAISIQVSSTELRAALAVVTPVFVDVLADPEMTLYAPIAAIIAAPEKVSIVDHAKLN